MKQSRSGFLVLPVLAAALCAACAGSDFEWDKARQIQPGMSQDQVSALMGSPTGVRNRDDVTFEDEADVDALVAFLMSQK